MNKNSVYVNLEMLPPEERPSNLASYITDCVLQILKWDRNRHGDAESGFTEIKLDSLLAVELSFRLEKVFYYTADIEENFETEADSILEFAEILLDRKIMFSDSLSIECRGFRHEQ